MTNKEFKEYKSQLKRQTKIEALKAEIRCYDFVLAEMEKGLNNLLYDRIPRCAKVFMTQEEIEEINNSLNAGKGEHAKQFVKSKKI